MDDLPEPHRIVQKPGLVRIGIDEDPSPAERRGALEDIGRPDDLLQDSLQNGGVILIRVIGIEQVSEEEKFPVPILCHRDRQVGVGRYAEAVGDGMPLPGIVSLHETGSQDKLAPIQESGIFRFGKRHGRSPDGFSVPIEIDRTVCADIFLYYYNMFWLRLGIGTIPLERISVKAGKISGVQDLRSSCS
jgi:hypothetical protein